MSSKSYEAMTAILSGKRVLLVGGAGFIGHNLALELRARGAQVMVADNLMQNNIVANVFGNALEPVQRAAYLGFLLERFRLLREAGVDLRNADARIASDVKRLFEEFQPQLVVHLSAISSAVDAEKMPGRCFDLQLVTLRNVLESCRTMRGAVEQVMFLSSSTVYGEFATPTLDETATPAPKGLYANTKYMGERLVRTYSLQHDVPSTIIRPSALYGERCISRRVSQLFIENALRGKPLLLEGGGQGQLDFTYIVDLVNGMVRALAHETVPQYTNTFNITFGRARTIAELAAIVQELVPDVVIEKRPPADNKPNRGTLSTKRAEEVLCFRAEWTLEEGYRRYCEWYIERWQAAKALSGDDRDFPFDVAAS